MRIDLRSLRLTTVCAATGFAALLLTEVVTAQSTTPSKGSTPATAAPAATSPASADSTTAAGAAATPEINIQDLFSKGDAALKAGDFQAALSAYNDLVNAGEHATTQELFQALPKAYLGRGHALAGLKEYDAAVDDYKKIIDSDPTNVAALIGRGQVYLEVNQIDPALPDFQAAAKIERGNLDALIGLGKALVMAGRSEEAILPLTHVITTDPKNAEAFRLRGAAYAGTSKTKKAVEDLQQAIALNPDDYEAYFTLGIVYVRDEDHQNAIDPLAKAVEHYKPKSGHEDDPYLQGYLTLASAYTDLGKDSKDEAASKAAYHSAIDTCEKLLKQLDPKNTAQAQAYAATLFSRAVAERMLGDYGTAIKTFSHAIELNPGLGEAYYRRGICFEKLGEDKMALTDFQQAAHILDDPRANLWEGFTYSKLGDYHKALRAYGDAIAASDRYTPAYANRGLAYMMLGEYEKALADFNESIRLEPSNADHYFKRGVAYEQLKDNQKASESFATAIEFDNKNEKAYRHMADVMKALGRNDLSTEYQQKADALAPPKKNK